MWLDVNLVFYFLITDATPNKIYKCEIQHQWQPINYNYHDSSDVGFDFSHSGFLIIDDHLWTVSEKEKRAFCHRKRERQRQREVGVGDCSGGWWMRCGRCLSVCLKVYHRTSTSEPKPKKLDAFGPRNSPLILLHFFSFFLSMLFLLDFLI